MSTLKEVQIPDIGGAKNVTVIELLVKPGDVVAVDSSLITLESDKASMDIPAPFAGTIKELKVKVGDKVSEGSVILTMEIASETTAPPKEIKPEETPPAQEKSVQTQVTQVPELSSVETKAQIQTPAVSSEKEVHASPAVRRLAREFGIDLTQISASGQKNRILKEDVQRYVKQALTQSPSMTSGAGWVVAAAPVIDFSQFGDIETQSLNKIKKLTGVNVHRSWVTVPHVTQFIEADITELEAFRESQKKEAEKRNIKLTPLVFIMKAVVAALKAFPQFNASLDSTGEQLILKKYFNLGVAVDTPNGLVVPVIRKVDQKGLYSLAEELAQVSKKAREKGLSLTDMQGGCFTISSLGGIGGTAFTPIVNAPDVAILGVSKASIKPIYQKDAFIPRLLLPLSLSYDHRVIDGADGARFSVYLAERLSDIRTLLL